MSNQLSPKQIATRFMASEVEHVNRLLHTRDLSVAKAKLMLIEAAYEATKRAAEPLIIETDINAGRAWFNIL